MTSTPNTGYLIEDQWDDWFQYSTMYDLYIVDSLSHQCYMGKTKIGQKGMVEDQRRPALPESFSRLSEDFFSLGQDSYYYENIKNLGDVMRSEILAALNDIAFSNFRLCRMAGRASIICTPCQPFLIIFYLSRFRYKTVSDTEYTISETTLLIFLLPPFALSLRWLPIALAQILQPLCFRNLCLHLHD